VRPSAAVSALTQCEPGWYGAARVRAHEPANLWAKTLPASPSPWTVLFYAFVTGALVWLPIAPPW
jgi:hypothetical protein